MEANKPLMVSVDPSGCYTCSEKLARILGQHADGIQAGQSCRFRYLVDGNDWLDDWHAEDHLGNPYNLYDLVLDLTESGTQS